MWSCRLNQIKSSRTKKSITNSKPIAEVTSAQSFTSINEQTQNSYFFSQIGNLRYLLELFAGGNILAMILALAEAQSWQALNGMHLLQYILYINWVLLCFAALVELFHQAFQRMGIKLALKIIKTLSASSMPNQIINKGSHAKVGTIANA